MLAPTSSAHAYRARRCTREQAKRSYLVLAPRRLVHRSGIIVRRQDGRFFFRRNLDRRWFVDGRGNDGGRHDAGVVDRRFWSLQLHGKVLRKWNALLLTPSPPEDSSTRTIQSLAPASQTFATTLAGNFLSRSTSGPGRATRDLYGHPLEPRKIRICVQLNLAPAPTRLTTFPGASPPHRPRGHALKGAWMRRPPPAK